VELAEAHAEELAERAGRISTINPIDEVVVADEDVEAGPEVGPAERRMRVNTDLENVVIGQGTNYTFLRGKVYTVPAHVYDHLEEKGYVYH